MLNMSNDMDHSVAFQALGWKPLKTERKKSKAKIVYKLLNKMGPKLLSNLFTCKGEVTNYKLRNISSSLCLPQPRTNNMKKSFVYDGAHLWNSILKEIRESKSFSSFRKKIAAHIDCGILKEYRMVFRARLRDPCTILRIPRKSREGVLIPRAG